MQEWTNLAPDPMNIKPFYLLLIYLISLALRIRRKLQFGNKNSAFTSSPEREGVPGLHVAPGMKESQAFMFTRV